MFGSEDYCKFVNPIDSIKKKCYNIYKKKEKKFMLEDYYFNEKDYEIFNEENVSSIRPEIIEQRKIVQQKLYDINDDIKDKLLEKNLHNHWRNENITSLIYPCAFNKGKVNWLGIRYGRSKREIALLNYNLGFNDKDKLGFQKYACFQLNVERKGIAIGLYHAVEKNAVDRMYLHENIDDKTTILCSLIKQIQGLGITWYISDSEGKIQKFAFDDESPNNFMLFYKNFDKDGCTSAIFYEIPKKDKRIKTKEGIEEITLEIINYLYDFYQEIIWKKKED